MPPCSLPPLSTAPTPSCLTLRTPWPCAKDTARMLVFHALQHPMYQDIETVVRINPLSTPFGLLDLEAAVRAWT